MPVPTSNISLAAVQSEFGGSNPISLNEYYLGGGNVIGGTSNSDLITIPSSGAISLNNFKGASFNFSATISPEGPESSAYLGYFLGPPVDGGINRTLVGRSRSNSNTYTLIGAFESQTFDFFTFNFDFFYEILFDGLISDPTFFSALNVTSSKGSLNLTRASAFNGANGTFDSGIHRWQWFLGSNNGSSGWTIVGAGSHNIELVYSGG